MNGRKLLFHYVFVFVCVLLLASGCTDKDSGTSKPPSTDQDQIAEKTVEWKTVYPGVYDAEEQALFDVTREITILPLRDGRVIVDHELLLARSTLHSPAP